MPIGYAAALIRSGEAELLLSGGADACVTPGMIYGFSRMRAVSTAFNDEPARASRRSTAPETGSSSRRSVDGGARARGPGTGEGRHVYASIDG